MGHDMSHRYHTPSITLCGASLHYNAPPALVLPIECFGLPDSKHNGQGLQPNCVKPADRLFTTCRDGVTVRTGTARRYTKRIPVLRTASHYRVGQPVPDYDYRRLLLLVTSDSSSRPAADDTKHSATSKFKPYVQIPSCPTFEQSPPRYITIGCDYELPLSSATLGILSI